MQIIRFKTGQLPELAGTPSADHAGKIGCWIPTMYLMIGRR